MENKDIRNAVKYITLGMEFGGCVLLFTFLGVYLDKKFVTNPLFLIVGIFTGFFFGIYRLFQVSKELDKMDKDKK